MHTHAHTCSRQGFDAAGKRAVVIGATNRKTDLDAALLSRFDLVGGAGWVLLGANPHCEVIF